MFDFIKKVVGKRGKNDKWNDKCNLCWSWKAKIIELISYAYANENQQR